MRLQRIPAAGAALAVLLNSAASAQAPAADDWDFGQDPGEKLAIAAVSFETFGVAVRCRDNVLSVVMSGLPVASGERKLRYQMGNGEEGESTWVSGRNSPSAFALWPRRVAADLRGGGTLRIAAMEGDQVRRYQVDLPPSSVAIPAVLTACGLDATQQDEAPTGETLRGLRWVSRPDATFPSRTTAETGLAAIQCRLRSNGGFRDCEIESEFPEGAGFGRAATLGSHRTARVAATGPESVDLEGRRVAFVVRYNSFEALLAPPPSRLPNRAETYNLPPAERERTED